MSKFERIRQILASAFAVDVGLSEIEQRQLLLRSLSNNQWRVEFQNELLEAFSSHETSWSNLLWNSEYEVIDTESENEARSIAATLLWEPTFPNKPLPQLLRVK